tara:strand:+ start:4472 stop:4801 length:330 start_codon:yes stop_codon:yes gene_type:complete
MSEFEKTLNHIPQAMVAITEDLLYGKAAGVRTSLQPWQVERAFNSVHSSVIQMKMDAGYKGQVKKSTLLQQPQDNQTEEQSLSVEERFDRLEAVVDSIATKVDGLTPPT